MEIGNVVLRKLKTTFRFAGPAPRLPCVPVPSALASGALALQFINGSMFLETL